MAMLLRVESIAEIPDSYGMQAIHMAVVEPISIDGSSVVLRCPMAPEFNVPVGALVRLQVERG
jgi:hypothetical protein